MKTKTYYYKFNWCDSCFAAVVAALAVALWAPCPITWAMVGITILVWGYKNILKQRAVVITEKDITIDHCRPLLWKDVKNGEIKDVQLCGQPRKILSLIPKKNITYTYNFLQKHNCDFGPFPIPLYGILTPQDEKDIVKEVKKYTNVIGE